MEDFERPVKTSDPMLACCLCRGLLQEAVQLICLHCCCRQCFSNAASKGSSHHVRCDLCGTVTQVGSELRNDFVDSQVTRYTFLANSKTCGPCKGNVKIEKTALVWCPSCKHSLCRDCITVHEQYFQQHVTQSLEEISSLDELHLPMSPVAGCSIHNKSLEIACANCEKAMCVSCWAECKEKKHDVHIVGKEAFNNYVDTFITSISAMENELLRKSEVLKRPKIILRNTQASRHRHLEDLNRRKRRVVDVVETVYEEIERLTKNAYDEIEKDEEDNVATADHIKDALSDAKFYISRLLKSNYKCDILNQQTIVQSRLRTLSAELDSLSNQLSTTMREVKIEASLPEDLEDVFRSWIGLPLIFSTPSSSSSRPLQNPHQQKQHNFSFGAASVSVQLPVTCNDVALTKDGRSLLLAAAQHGLLEFSSSCGHELRRWQPPKINSDTDDQVLAVAALSNGQAAVSLYYTRLVVLLRREEKLVSSSGIAPTAGEAWTEQFRFDPLPCYAYQLSVHGDLLAASLYWYGTDVQLLSLSSGKWLNGVVLQRPYAIGGMAVAAGLIVTCSCDKIHMGDDRRASHVLDAYIITEGGSEEHVWHQDLSTNEEEELQGICADSSDGCLYAALCRSDRSNGRICVLSLTDGSELRRVALICDAAGASPWRLSLSSSGYPAEAGRLLLTHYTSREHRNGRVVLLAALCENRRTVTVHLGCVHNERPSNHVSTALITTPDDLRNASETVLPN